MVVVATIVTMTIVAMIVMTVIVVAIVCIHGKWRRTFRGLGRGRRGPF
jgi:hypothetical protein